MDLLRRIGIFSIGLSIGLITLAFFFKGKGVEVCYFPNCRVLKDIRNKPVFIEKNLEKEGYTLEVLKPIFWNGNVNFNKSDTQSVPCKTYVITGNSTTDQSLQITVRNCKKEAFVVSVEKIN